MAFGILVGTYSSIYIALPVVLLWGVKRGEGGPEQPIDMAPATRSGRAARAGQGLRAPHMAAAVRQAPAIESFGGGGFVIQGERFAGSVLILGDVARPWPPLSLADLTAADFTEPFANRAEAEFVLLGCGARMLPPPRPLREAFQAARMGLEVMTTPEACRLYNVLAADGRRIAAALLAV